MATFLEIYKKFCNSGTNLEDFCSRGKDITSKGLVFSVFQGNKRAIKAISTDGIKYVEEAALNIPENKELRQQSFKDYTQTVLPAGYFNVDASGNYSLSPKGRCIKQIVTSLSDNENKDNTFCITLISILDGKFKNPYTIEENNCFVRNVIRLIGIFHNIGYTTNEILSFCEAALKATKKEKFTPWQYEIFWLLSFYRDQDFLRSLKNCFRDGLNDVVNYIDDNKRNKNYSDIVSNKYKSGGQYQVKTFIEDVEIVYSILRLITDIHNINTSAELAESIVKSISFSRDVDSDTILSCIDENKEIFDIVFNHIRTDLYVSSFSALLQELRGNTRSSSLKKYNISENIYNQYLTAIRTKPFLLLAGISGTGKSRIVRKLAQATVTEELQKKYDKEYKGTDFKNDRWNLHTPANFELIQVKPNWHNSMDVVGYLSNIPSPHYVFTPFVEFIARAWQHQGIPFFLCLDEMNLAPVEEYFAEFLSAIESRSFENKEYLTDPIIKPFSKYKEVKGEDGKTINIEDQMLNDLLPKVDPSKTEEAKVITHVSEHFKNKGLTLPKNLIVIGTVNMDETTFSFSRKVLDRAMSIEMNEVKYNMFLADTTDDGLKQIVKDFEDNKYGEGITLNSYLVDRHIEAKEIFANGNEDAITVIDYLTRINNLLEGTPFKLGYRAANEALIYVKATEEFKSGGVKSALDSFTLMKILSRMEGDESKLTVLEDEQRLKDAKLSADKVKEDGKITLLTCLRQIIKEELTYDIEQEVPTPEVNSEDNEQESLVNEEETKAAENEVVKTKVPVDPKSVKKLDNMIAQLRRDHFVSYWN